MIETKFICRNCNKKELCELTFHSEEAPAKPTECVLSITTAKWKKYGESKTEAPPEPKMPQNETCIDKELSRMKFGLELSLIEKSDSHTKKTPNCAICNWKENELRFDPDTPDNSDKYFELSYMLCNAQGGSDTDECYNTPECKNLFSKKSIAKYRLLETGEEIIKGDEHYDSGGDWIKSQLTGKFNAKQHSPLRRAI